MNRKDWPCLKAKVGRGLKADAGRETGYSRFLALACIFFSLEVWSRSQRKHLTTEWAVAVRSSTGLKISCITPIVTN